MPAVEKVWHLLPHDRDAITRFAAAVKVSPVVAQLLLNRGVADPKAAARFLAPHLSGLHAPESLPNVPDAADRIAKAVVDRRKICVYGDYDVDGVTGTAILIQLLAKLGAEVEYHVPLRLSEGYGLNAEKLRELAARGVSLVVSVDCGIANLAEAEEARRLGLELIVTDHHEMKTGDGGELLLPRAAAVVHPRLPGGSYPFGGLCGAGVAFKLAWAVAQRASGGEKTTPELRDLLLDAVGLVALGLVADVVPLQDESRIFVKHGLERVRTNPTVGLKALLEAAKVGGSNGAIKAEDVGFRLAPRLNAAGRLDCARLAVELLTTRNPARARELAEYLEKQNQDRQTLERRITQQARDMLDGADLAVTHGIVLAHAEWHPGVVGIVAGRLAEQYARPVLVAAIRDGNEVATGSGRSVPGFPLHEALKACEAELISHGGHAAAAGFKLAVDRIPTLRARFNAAVAAHFPGGLPPPMLKLDAEVPVSSLTLGLLKDIDKLEPYGAQNPKPKFLASGLKIEGTPRRMGQSERHLNFRVKQGQSSIRAVAWGMGDRLDELMSAGGECCLAFSPRLNEWNGQRNVEIEVIDLKPGRTVKLG